MNARTLTALIFLSSLGLAGCSRGGHGPLSDLRTRVAALGDTALDVAANIRAGGERQFSRDQALADRSLKKMQAEANASEHPAPVNLTPDRYVPRPTASGWIVYDTLLGETAGESEVTAGHARQASQPTSRMGAAKTAQLLNRGGRVGGP